MRTSISTQLSVYTETVHSHSQTAEKTEPLPSVKTTGVERKEKEWSGTRHKRWIKHKEQKEATRKEKIQGNHKKTEQ